MGPAVLLPYAGDRQCDYLPGDAHKWRRSREGSCGEPDPVNSGLQSRERAPLVELAARMFNNPPMW